MRAVINLTYGVLRTGGLIRRRWNRCRWTGGTGGGGTGGTGGGGTFNIFRFVLVSSVKPLRGQVIPDLGGVHASNGGCTCIKMGCTSSGSLPSLHIHLQSNLAITEVENLQNSSVIARFQL